MVTVMFPPHSEILGFCGVKKRPIKKKKNPAPPPFRGLETSRASRLSTVLFLLMLLNHKFLH